MLRTLVTLACVFLTSLMSMGEERPATDLSEVRGVVLDEAGQPIAGAMVKAISEPIDPPSTKSDAQGRFTLQVDRKRSLNLKLFASASGGRQQAMFSRDGGKPQPLDAVEIKLGKTREITVTVVDEKEQPVSGASAVAVASYSKLTEQPTDAKGYATLVVPAGVDLQYVYVLKPKVGLDYFYFRQAYQKDESNPYWLEQDHAKPLQLTLRGMRPVTVRVVDNKDRPLTGALVYPWYIELPKKGADLNTGWTYRTTGEDGVVEFDTIPSGSLQKINFWATKDRYSAPQRWMFDPAGTTNEITAQLVPQVLLKGQVFRARQRAAGATVKIVGDGYSFDSFHSNAVCDQEGKFEIYVDDDKAYAIMAEGERECSGVELRVITAGRKIKPIDLALEPATRVFGTLRGIADQKPLVGEYLMLQMTDADVYYQLPKDERLPDKGSTKGITLRHTRNARTDAQGRFEFYAGKGSYYLWNENVEAAQFALDGQKELEVNLQTKRPPKAKLQLKVVHAGDPRRPVADAQVQGVGLEETSVRFGGTTDAEGKFTTLREPMPARVFARSADGLLCGLSTWISTPRS